MPEQIETGPVWQERSMSFKWIGMVAILAVVAAVVWHKTLSNGFVWHDVPQVAANLAARDGAVADYFIDANTSANPDWRDVTPVFRPLRTLSYRLDFMIGGALNSKVGHANNLLLHLVNASLILVLARLMGFGLAGSLFVSLLFLVHPVQSEAVCWLACRDVLLSTALVLMGLVYAVWRLPRRWRAFDLVVLGFLYLAACLASPQAILFPAMLGIVAVAMRAEEEPEVRQTNSAPGGIGRAGAWGAVVVFAAVAGLYFWWALAASDGITQVVNGADGGWRVKLLSVPRCISLVLAPATLTPDYSDMGTGRGGEGVLAALGGVLLVFVMFLIIRCWRVRPALSAALALGWFGIFAAWLVHAGFPGESMLYMPMVGFALAAGFLLQMLAAARIQAAVIAVGLILMLASVRTLLRAGDWSNDGSLLYPALEYSPDNKAVLRQLMRHYLALRDFPRASVVADGLLVVTPSGPGFGVLRAEPLLVKGEALMATGTVEQGRALYDEAIAADPYYGKPVYDLGFMKLQAGMDEEALPLLQKACFLMPHNGAVHEHLGVALERLGKTNVAEVVFRRAAENEWLAPSAANRLAVLLIKQGRMKEAIEVCRRSLRRFPGDPNLAMWLEKASGTVTAK